MGFGPASHPSDGARLREWLDAGHAGSMAWMGEGAAGRAEPALRYQGVRSVVAVSLAHDPGGGPPPGDGPRGVIARYARGADYHRVMERKLKRLRDAVVRAGGPGTRAWWAVDHVPVMDRALARNAGLGFFGKNTMLIDPRRGSWLLLGEVLTTLELPADPPAAGSCGTCRRCLDVCPTKAFPAPFVLDARRCISYLTIEHRGPIPEELRPGIGTMVFGCDLCQEVCPWNRFARKASSRDLRPRALSVDPDLIGLAALTEVTWREAFAGSPILRAGWAGFRRNVAVALGNSRDRRALPALRALASCGDPLVEEHAARGIGIIDVMDNTALS